MKRKHVLKSVQSFRSINSSPTNRSISKQTFTFSKSPRFEKSKAQCPLGSYNGQHILKKKPGAGMGYGKKYDFMKVQTSSPGSSTYYMKTLFEDNQSKKKGYTLRAGRSTIVYDSYINQEVCKNPSANKYNNENNLKSKSPIYSMRKKTKQQDLRMTINSQNSNPGPGTYQNPEIDSPSAIASKFKKLSYGTSRSKRFLNPDNKVPGPANYLDISSLSAVGKYIVSNKKGGTGAKFSKDYRVTEFQKAAKMSQQKPGPGRYRSPSQFGYYDDIYNTTNTISVSRVSRRK